MKGVLILGVVGVGKPSIQFLENYDNVGVVSTSDESFPSIMYPSERDNAIKCEDNPLKPLVNQVHRFMENLSSANREYVLENIIKRSKNPLAVINAKRELGYIKFNMNKRKSTKVRR